MRRLPLPRLEHSALGRRALYIVLALAAAGGALEAQAQQAATAEGLIGVWAVDTTLVPQVQGRLTVTRRAGQWEAAIAGAEARVEVRGDSLRILTAGNRGELRATVPVGPGNITGFWIQPPGKVWGGHYAFPVTLVSRAAGTWSGDVRPLIDRYRLFLLVRREADGTVRGFFRNPERNARGAVSRWIVSVVGDSAIFTDSSGTRRLAAEYDRRADRIRIAWPQIGATLTLARRDPAAAAGLYPRSGPGDTAYTYRAPRPGNDGWRVARGRDVGVDERGLHALVHQALAVDPADRLAPAVHSILVARRGRLVLEEYFHGYDADTPHDTRSGGKTFASVLVGAVRQQMKTPLDPDMPVLPVLAGNVRAANPDPRKDRIRLRHLMTMTHGLACDENDDDSPGNEERLWNGTAPPDWYRFAIDLPMQDEPGSQYRYCSLSPNLVGAVVRARTGEWLPALFDRTVARPLDIRRYYMLLTPTRELYFGGGTQLRPRDFLKFGQLYLDGGVWRGRRIVSADWVRESTVRQSPPDSTSPGDGYNWHLIRLSSGGREYHGYEANGNGGQFVIVIPELELAVTYTAGNYMAYQIWRRFRDDWIPQILIPAIAR